MRKQLAFLWVILGCLLPAVPCMAAPPPLQVTVNFDSTATYKTSDGTTHTATASGLSDADKAAIIAKAQQKFDEALGPGQVVVSQGTGGDMNIIVSGETPPATYGNEGLSGGAGVVYTGTMQARGLGTTFPSGSTALANCAGETLAHEIAHKLGVNHNGNAGAIMSDRIPDSIRAVDSRNFTGNDVAIMRKTIPLYTSAGLGARAPTAKQLTQPPAAFSEAAPTGTEGPGGYAPQMFGDDSVMDTKLQFIGPANSEFGYIDTTGDFILQADAIAAGWTMDFAGDNPYDFAVKLDNGTIINLDCPDVCTLQLLDPNPNAPGATTYETLIENFSTPEGAASATWTVTDPTVDFGFTALPSPTSAVGISALLLGLVCRRSIQRFNSSNG